MEPLLFFYVFRVLYRSLPIVCDIAACAAACAAAAADDDDDDDDGDFVFVAAV